MREPHARLDSAVILRQNLQDRIPLQNASALLADRIDVLRRQPVFRQRRIDPPQILRRRLLRRAARNMQSVHQLLPRHRVRILLAEIRQHAGNVLLKHRIQRQQIDIARPQCLAVMVKQIGDPLQEHACFAAASNAVHQQHRHIRIPDDRVLLLLNRHRDRLHFVRPLL